MSAWASEGVVKMINHLSKFYLFIIHTEYVIHAMPIYFQILAPFTFTYGEIRKITSKSFEIFWTLGSK